MTSLLQPVARKLPRQDRSRALVEAILEAAARILVSRGREAVTTNSVALVAGASIGSLYQYFPNREAILAAVASEHARRLYDCVADVDIDEADTLAEAVTLIVAGLFAAHAINPALHVALEGDLRRDHAYHRGNSKHAGTRPAFVALILALPQTMLDEIKVAPPERAAPVVAEIAHGLAHVAIGDPEMPTRDGIEIEAVRAVLAYLQYEL